MRRNSPAAHSGVSRNSRAPAHSIRLGGIQKQICKLNRIYRYEFAQGSVGGNRRSELTVWWCDIPPAQAVAPRRGKQLSKYSWRPVKRSWRALQLVQMWSQLQHTLRTSQARPCATQHTHVQPNKRHSERLAVGPQKASASSCIG